MTDATYNTCPDDVSWCDQHLETNGTTLHQGARSDHDGVPVGINRMDYPTGPGRIVSVATVTVDYRPVTPGGARALADALRAAADLAEDVASRT